MTQVTGKILKSSQVNIEGKCQLGLAQTDHKPTQNINTKLKSPQARILENNEGCVIIQVTCSCGEQINIRGEYIKEHS